LRSRAGIVWGSVDDDRFEIVMFTPKAI
jgi:hypothetical protein